VFAVYCLRHSSVGWHRVWTGPTQVSGLSSTCRRAAGWRPSSPTYLAVIRLCAMPPAKGYEIYGRIGCVCLGLAHELIQAYGETNIICIVTQLSSPARRGSQIRITRDLNAASQAGPRPSQDQRHSICETLSSSTSDSRCPI